MRVLREKQRTHEAIVVSQFDLESQAGNHREEQIQKLVLILLHTSSPLGTCLRVPQRRDFSSPGDPKKEPLK